MRRFRHRGQYSLPSNQHPALARARTGAFSAAARRRPRLALAVPATMVLVLAVLGLSIATAPGSNAAASPRPTARDLAGVEQLHVAASPDPGKLSGDGHEQLPAPTAAPTIHVPAASDLSGYVWPLAHGRVTLPFGPTEWGTFEVDGQLFHDGVDMATFCGDHVVAAHDGVVLAEGRRFDQFLGWRGSLNGYFARLDREHRWLDLPIVVVVDDGNGYRSMYAHFDSTVVSVGQHVKAGQLLGYEGRTGNASGCHLHYGLFDPDEAATFDLEQRIADLLVLPHEETARIDPLEVLPLRAGVEEQQWRMPDGRIVRR